MNSNIEALLIAAEEIRAEGHAGWGNTIDDAIREIQRLESGWADSTVEIGELQGTIKLLRKDKQMFYEVEKGRAEQAAIDKDFIQQYQREIEQLQASRKRDCVDFFRWFWNQPGTNAEQGYDKWLSLQTKDKTGFERNCANCGEEYGGIGVPLCPKCVSDKNND